MATNQTGQQPAQRAPAPGPQGEPRRNSFRQAVMTTVTMHMKFNPDFTATLVDISESGCRVRAAIMLDIGTDIFFDWARHNKPPLRLTGRVMTRRRTQGMMLYDYGIAFQGIKAELKDAIISETLELQRREAMRNQPTESSMAKTVAAQLGTKRAAYRAMVEFEIWYTVPGRFGKRPGTASDLSLGGMRLDTTEKLPEGTLIDFVFTLPNQYLKVYEGDREETEVSPFGARKVVRKSNVRPFEEMRLRGRVVKVLKEAAKVQLGIAFVDPHPFIVSELGRFIHAVQLSRLRAERPEGT
jgi:c-di-GMP-binding flagellar brake protein YcgR